MPSSSSNAIGFFDSGLGGLTILSEVCRTLPNEQLIYLADSKNAPYGKKSNEEIIALSIKNTEKLISLNCKIIVVACNTATTTAIKILRENFDVLFVGIEPAIKPAVLKSISKKIGVLATKGTLNSKLFASTTKSYRSTHSFIEVEGNGLVELIESGKINATKTLLEFYLKPMLIAGVDNIVLGCSHYPMLIPVIRQITGPNITIIDSGEAVARQVKNILTQNNLLCTKKTASSNQFYINGRNKEVMLTFFKKLSIKNYIVKVEDF